MLLQIIGQIVALDTWYLSLTHSFGRTRKFTTTKFGVKKTRNTALSCGVKGISHLETFRRKSPVCDGQTDGQTDRTAFSSLTSLDVRYF